MTNRKTADRNTVLLGIALFVLGLVAGYAWQQRAGQPMIPALYLVLIVIGLALLGLWARQEREHRLPQRGGGFGEVLLPGPGPGVDIIRGLAGLAIIVVGSITGRFAGDFSGPTIPCPIPHPEPDQVVGTVYRADGTLEPGAIVRLVLEGTADVESVDLTQSTGTNDEPCGYRLASGSPSPKEYRVEARTADGTPCGEPRAVVLPTGGDSGQRFDFTCPETGSVHRE